MPLSHKHTHRVPHVHACFSCVLQVSSDLKSVTHDRLLTDVGELEQDLVLGEKNSKDLINFLTGGC